METSTQLSRCCWVRKTNLRAKRNFTWGMGIYRSSVSHIIHKVLRLKWYKKRRAQQLTEAQSMHALFSACSLRDDNVITSKLTWKLKHATSIRELYECFCQISSRSIHIISSYTVSKLGRFLRHSLLVNRSWGWTTGLAIAPAWQRTWRHSINGDARTCSVHIRWSQEVFNHLSECIHVGE